MESIEELKIPEKSASATSASPLRFSETAAAEILNGIKKEQKCNVNFTLLDLKDPTCCLLRTVFLEFSGQVLPAPRRRRAAQQSCQDTTSHLLTTSQLQSSRHASCRHHSSCYDQRRRHLARQGPVCNVTITMSASSIAQRQTCCQATASWFVDEYGT